MIFWHRLLFELKYSFYFRRFPNSIFLNFPQFPGGGPHNPLRAPEILTLKGVERFSARGVCAFFPATHRSKLYNNPSESRWRPRYRSGTTMHLDLQPANRHGLAKCSIAQTMLQKVCTSGTLSEHCSSSVRFRDVRWLPHAHQHCLAQPKHVDADVGCVAVNR